MAPARGWSGTVGNARSCVGNALGGLRRWSNLASWAVAGTLAYYLWVKPARQLQKEQEVERFMEMWNKDEDFRRQYVESNKISTLRRLGTSGGRRIGPDEVPPEIPSSSNRKPSNPSLLPVFKHTCPFQL